MTVSTTTSGRMTGLLSGSGADQLRVTVHTAAVPQHLPAELEGLASPVYDPDGHLYDWRLDPSHADHAAQVADFQQFAGWRARYATEWFLGERILISTFLDWAEHHCDLSALNVLRLDHCHLDYHRSLEVGRQLAQAQQYLQNHPATGWGLFSARAVKPIRGIVSGDEPITVLALGRDVVTAGQDGIGLRHGAEQQTVTGWRLGENGVTARTEQGTVELAKTPAARLLRIVGRQAPEIEVRSCSLHELVAPLLSFGREASEIAGVGHTGMYFRSHWS